MAWMDRQTLSDWVHRYNADGIECLKSRKSPGRAPFLTVAQKAELRELVIKGPDPAMHKVVRWRCADLRVDRRGKLALTQSWCIFLPSLCGPDQTCPKQIQVSSAVHLPLDQLEFRILPLGLAVRPWLCESRLYRHAVLGDPGCE